VRARSGGSALLATRTPHTSGRAAQRPYVALMATRHLRHASPASEGATGRACARWGRMARTLAVQANGQGGEAGVLGRAQPGRGRSSDGRGPAASGAAVYVFARLALVYT